MMKLLAKKYDGILWEENYHDQLLPELDSAEFPFLTYTRDLRDGKKSLEIISETEMILAKKGIILPDHTKVLFSSADERNGWGNDFDGRFLSVILNQSGCIAGR